MAKTENITTCLVCGAARLSPELRVAPQPISNRFLSAKNETQELFPLALGQCKQCGVVQLTERAPAQALKPKVDWITYREPESHLDQMVRMLSGLKGMTTSSNIGALSFKDDSTLERFKKSGFVNVYRLDAKADLGVNDAGAGVETIQHVLNSKVSEQVIKAHGKFDMLIVRHVLEHAYRPTEFVAALTAMLSDDGYLVFEVPDCKNALERHDYTTIWEEHMLYFTPESLMSSVCHLNLELSEFALYPYPFENSLLAVAKKNKGERPCIFPSDEMITEAEAFFSGFKKKTSALQALLATWKKQAGPIALFGAGHLSGSFVTLHQLESYIDFVVDDNEHKQNMFMPGCALPIYPSSKLMDGGVKICLLGFNPELESKVVGKFPDFRGKFYSIFPGSKRKLPL